jgi:hypothetical protein
MIEQFTMKTGSGICRIILEIKNFSGNAEVFL